MEAFFTDCWKNLRVSIFCGRFAENTTVRIQIIKACWNHRLFELSDGQDTSAGRYTEVAITLGEGLDRLQEEYAGK